MFVIGRAGVLSLNFVNFLAAEEGCRSINACVWGSYISFSLINGFSYLCMLNIESESKQLTWYIYIYIYIYHVKYIYIYIYHHHHHHHQGILTAQIFLTLSSYLSIVAIALSKSSRRHPMNNVSFCWSANTSLSICSCSFVNIAYESIFTLPAVPIMSCLSYLDGL